MSLKALLPILILGGLIAMAWFPGFSAKAGEVSLPPSGYKILDPIRHGNLTVFPVVAATTHNTQEFLTLDEGVRSGEVVVTEYGNVPLMRRRNPAQSSGSAQVNQLVLINNSKRPLILLAGEIVTGGKQDRVIGKDRIVAPESDPIDLNVFCVEPGRWTATSTKFGSMGYSMAQPAVRAKAMAAKDQAQVWDQVRKQQGSMAETVTVTAEASSVQTSVAAIGGTTSYARVMENDAVKQQVDSVAKPIEKSYQSVIGQLREKNAVGVIVAIKGEIVWADIFASGELLEKYWPKLIRSYAAEAVTERGRSHDATLDAAEKFLTNMDGRHENIENEPGLYRHTEINGDGFHAFELTSLLPKTNFDLHVAKMAE